MLTVFLPTVTHQAILAFMTPKSNTGIRSMRIHTSTGGSTHTESDDVYEVETLIPAPVPSTSSRTPAHVRSGRIKKRQQPVISKAGLLPDYGEHHGMVHYSSTNFEPVAKPRPLSTGDLIRWVPRIVVEVVVPQALANAQEKALDWLNQEGKINVALIVHAPEAGQFRNPPDVQIPFPGSIGWDIENDMPYSQGHLGPYVHFLDKDDEDEDEAFSIQNIIMGHIYPYSERYKEYGWTWHGR